MRTLATIPEIGIDWPILVIRSFLGAIAVAFVIWLTTFVGNIDPNQDPNTCYRSSSPFTATATTDSSICASATTTGAQYEIIRPAGPQSGQLK